MARVVSIPVVESRGVQKNNFSQLVEIRRTLHVERSVGANHDPHAALGVDP
jgi:hypothetical protein